MTLYQTGCCQKALQQEKVSEMSLPGRYHGTAFFCLLAPSGCGAKLSRRKGEGIPCSLEQRDREEELSVLPFVPTPGPHGLGSFWRTG